ncbi:MAG: radical SAM protein [Bacteroidales bacterium]|nr:radical SAM protein [Bacteroidales bacterium]
MYKYLFGPVPSRRLGISLGVDLVPKKVCSLDCVYCEVGKTTKLTTDRKEYIPLSKIEAELEHFFGNNQDPDYITFSGSGEPTLNSQIGNVLQFIKKKKPNIPVAVLTNGTLLYNQDVTKEILDADLVLPSLDAASQSVFQKINRPHPLLSATKCIEGLVSFRNIYKGKIWLEVFILPGYNNTPHELDALKEAILKINPDRVQLNTLDRPGTVTDIRSATHQELQYVMDRWGLPNVEIIATSIYRKQLLSYQGNIESAILETIARRPCTLEDLCAMLGLHTNEINKYLSTMELEGKIESKLQNRGVFYSIPY